MTSLRVATSLQFDRLRDRMGTLSAKADLLNTQMSTTKRIQAPSDDAAGYRSLTALKRAGADSNAELENIDLATSLLEASSTALGTIETQLGRVREIAINAGTGTVSTEQKKALAAELDVIMDDLLRVANSSDSRGNPLFAGDSTAAPYTVTPAGKRPSEGVVSFTGKGEAGEVPIGDGRTIAATTSGEKVFGKLKKADGTESDMFAIVKELSDALKADTSIGNASADAQTALTSVTNARTSIGARGARLELEQARLQDFALTREAARSAIEDTDVTATITELQKTLTVLQATQASFSKLTSLNLFDYLR